MKTFIALELPDHIKDELCQIQQQLPDYVDLVDRAKFHLTLHFVGIVTDEERVAIIEALKTIQLNKFNLTLDAFGLFDNFGKVAWVGVKGEVEQLFALAAMTAEVNRQIKPQTDLPFHPHITLGRSKTAINCDVTIRPIQFTASAIHYIETCKTENGTIYVSLATQLLI